VTRFRKNRPGDYSSLGAGVETTHVSFSHHAGKSLACETLDVSACLISRLGITRRPAPEFAPKVNVRQGALNYPAAHIRRQAPAISGEVECALAFSLCQRLRVPHLKAGQESFKLKDLGIWFAPARIRYQRLAWVYLGFFECPPKKRPIKP